MNLIDETSVWLQTHIDGENNARFLQIVQPYRAHVSSLDVDQQKLWLASFWDTQLAAAGVDRTAQTIGYMQAVILSQGIDQYMRLLKLQVELHNLPRIT